jgi:signal transduction histidine kinase
VGFWSALADDDGRPWSLDDGGAEGGAPVMLSEDEVAAAVDALVGNVFAHTPEGTAYAVRVRVAGGRATLVVEDAGPGIDAPRAAVGRGASRAGSTGLGLDIARRAAQAARGGLAIDRSPLGGARVTLDVPLADRGP